MKPIWRKPARNWPRRRCLTGFSVTVPVYAGDLFDEEATVLIKESLAQLGIKLTLQKMPIGQKRSLLAQETGRYGGL